MKEESCTKGNHEIVVGCHLVAARMYLCKD